MGVEDTRLVVEEVVEAGQVAEVAVRTAEAGVVRPRMMVEGPTEEGVDTDRVEVAIVAGPILVDFPEPL